ncbi:hypothetical protein [Acetobacter ghanensis]|uniref:Uncharacterized protein n=1 Tax=Acetobacter ghanensis TaxID=431306 RepID=A0A0U5F444_9PROT|nr:hypothetical protein [Acetobacter ghanensis]NHO39826.1 hypothetical protein [Acetobacter ghanensis]GBQ49396.1 hypothetical protein AA18895_1616 [Acetobacter ghanensis DSM 18895]CEF53237.1 hypothetical protein predicted by Glimmer/Critica [Acetobacter ghanensis]
MKPYTTCPDHSPTPQVDTYTLAAQRGLFSTDTLPSATAQELARYEQAILHLRAASHSLQWPFYTNTAFAADQHRYCEESIGEIVQTVRDLLERQQQPLG